MSDQKAQRVANALNAARVELAARLAGAQGAIAQIGLGVSASVPLQIGAQGCDLKLGFCKVNKDWRLTIERPSEMPELLVEQELEVQRAAIPRLQVLVEALIAEAELQLREVQAATRVLQDFVRACEESKKEGA